MSDGGEKRSRLDRLSQIEETETNKRRTAWLMRLVVLFLVIVFLGGIVWGANDLVSREGTETPPDELAEIAAQHAAIDAAAPKTAEGMLAYIEDAAEAAKRECPQLSLMRSFDVMQDTVAFRDAQTLQMLDEGAEKRLQAAAALIAPALAEQLNSGYEPQETQFGDRIDDLLWPLASSETDLAEGSTCTYNNYICTAYGCDRAEDAPPEKCPNCGAEGMYQLHYLDDYTFALPFAGSTPEALAPFRLPSGQDLAALLEGALGENIILENAEVVSVHDAVMTSAVRRAQQAGGENQLQFLQYEVLLDIELTLRFTGELASLGGVRVGLTAANRTRFDFRWPGIALGEKTCSLEKRGGVTLKVTQIAPEGTPVIWKSNDENAAAVDAQGNVSAGTALGASAVITASMEVNGVLYEDSCVVTVKNDVDNIKISQKKLVLQPGQSARLHVSVSPRDATIQDVRWFTRDADIAAVDESGEVRAVAPGVVEIYALSVDGNLKSTCTLTVEGDT